MKSALIAAFALGTRSTAHSWVERIMRIGPNNTMIGSPGYARGLVPRGTPGYSEDKVTGLIPPNGGRSGPAIRETDLMAREGQRTPNYSSDMPMLTVTPGDMVAMQYQENGHVSLPDNQKIKPNNRGTIYIYGTRQSNLSNRTLVHTHLQWNRDGTGGDCKGKLLATRDYDDGQCYQVNGGDISKRRQKEFAKKAADPMGGDLWCQTDVQIPADAAVGGTYTMLWVWDWPWMSAPVDVSPAYIFGFNTTSMNPYVTKPEYYVSVVDFKIVDPCSKELGDVKGERCRHVSAGPFRASSYHDKSGSAVTDFNVGTIQKQRANPFLVQIDLSEEASQTLSTTASPTAAASASTPATNSTFAGNVSVVTVTVPAQTVTVFQTVLEDEARAQLTAADNPGHVKASRPTALATLVRSSAAAAVSGAGATGSAARPVVTPFQRDRK